MIHFIAWRFMLRGTEKGTFSAMTLFAWLAIGVGVGAMSSLLSVMYGLEGSLKASVLNAYPHIMVQSRDLQKPIENNQGWTEKLAAIPGVTRVLPYAQNEMIVQSKRRSLGAVIWGMPLKDMAKLKEHLSDGWLPREEAKIPEVIIGSELASRLSVIPGSEVQIISPIEKSGPMGMVPQTQTFQIAGLYTSGHYEFDEQYMFLVLEDMQDLLNWKNRITGWHVWADKLEDSEKVLPKIKAVLPADWEAIGWETFNSALFQSLKLEQYSMFSIFTFAIFIAVLNVVITLTMHVAHKRKNIGVLRALGASKDQIRKIFLWQGVMMGGVGLVLGAVLTTIFVIYVKYFSKFQLPDIYYDRSIPIELRPLSLVAIYVVASVFIYLATIYPASRAALLDPIEAIRE